MTGNTCPKIYQVRDADLAIRAIRDLGRRIVTFSGFSSNGYEDQSDVQRIICEVLDKLDPRTDIVCSGATRMGIGAVYALASSRGFESLGIVSTRARKEHVPFADDVDIVYVIEDESWGGYIDKRGTPSPTSRVMVDVSDMLVFIGGGDIARDEYDYAKRRRKAVEFFVADANHAAAIDQARRRGEPAPTDFRGSLALHCEAETK